VLERAIVELLKTPVVEGPIPLEQKKVMYEFADPSLEGLSAAQRQLLRMGPRNVRLVQNALRSVGAQLGIPTDRLPPPRVVQSARR
jgi:hypothetical protein